MTLTTAQRRAYIDTSRRLQPIEELRRKAAKAKRRNRSIGVEGVDLSFALDTQRRASDKSVGGFFTWYPIVFCCQCGSFGLGPFNNVTKRYTLPPAHKPRCIYGPDDSPYPGFSAVSSPIK